MPDYTFPVVFDGARITSGIGPRSAPIAGASTWHRGIDIAAPTGSPVVAPVPMEVIFAGQKSGYGNVIYAADQNAQIHRFGHLDSIGVGTGDMIYQGQQMGTVGSTGTATGPHLHYEVRDAAGNLLRTATEKVVNTGQRIANSAIGQTVNNILKSNPITAPFAIGASALGVNPLDEGESCGLNPVCHFQKWLEDTDFVERGALFIIATVLIIGGIVFLALGYKPDAIIRKAVS